MMQFSLFYTFMQIPAIFLIEPFTLLKLVILYTFFINFNIFITFINLNISTFFTLIFNHLGHKGFV